MFSYLLKAASGTFRSMTLKVITHEINDTKTIERKSRPFEKAPSNPGRLAGVDSSRMPSTQKKAFSDEVVCDG